MHIVYVSTANNCVCTLLNLVEVGESKLDMIDTSLPIFYSLLGVYYAGKREF